MMKQMVTEKSKTTWKRQWDEENQIGLINEDVENIIFQNMEYTVLGVRGYSLTT